MVVERFGRKPLLIFSDALMCVSIVSLGIYFYLNENITVICPDDGATTTESLFNFTTVSTTVSTNYTTTEATVVKCVPNDGVDPDLVDSLSWLPLVGFT